MDIKIEKQTSILGRVWSSKHKDWESHEKS
jgi:hypothetical protein